ncbi:protein kinase domain-containing protein [Ditylenchus destructor]|nr:protein kinase domain-containing protein [Ditylenchus destructor]
MEKARYRDVLRYRKIKQVGTGAFGRCFLCEKPDGSLVVLKKTKYCEKALDEARLLSELKHTNIVRIYEAQRSENCLYIILEFMEGGNLDVLIKEHKEEPFKDSVILSYSKQLAEALKFIHSKHVIHRDVKPANILLNADHATVKLSDFGISTRLVENEQAHGKIGTSSYMAPEMLEGRDYDFKCDIWSFGCVLFELVERRRVFSGSLEVAIQSKICSGSYTLPVGSKFCRLIQMLLSNSASARPTAEVLIQELNQFS